MMLKTPQPQNRIVPLVLALVHATLPHEYYNLELPTFLMKETVRKLGQWRRFHMAVEESL